VIKRIFENKSDKVLVTEEFAILKESLRKNVNRIDEAKLNMAERIDLID